MNKNIEITLDLKKRLYFQMLRIRMVEETIASIYPDQQIRCPVHLSIGQEAIAVGVSESLTKNDYAFSTHRSHAHFLAKGGSLNAMMAELYGKRNGCCGGKGGSMHLVDTAVNFFAVPILGSTIPMAVGTAFAASQQNLSYVSVVFFGEAAAEEGVFYESMNYASLKKLPVIFVCENNLYSVYSPISVRQPPSRNNLAIAKAHGINAVMGFGNNSDEVYEIAKAAVDRAMNGGGPSYLEFSTYRWREHCGPNYDNDLGYRTQSECDEWVLRDPLLQNTQSLIPQDERDFFVSTIQDEIDHAIRFAKNDEYPNPAQLYEDVFAK